MTGYLLISLRFGPSFPGPTVLATPEGQRTIYYCRQRTYSNNVSSKILNTVEIGCNRFTAQHNGGITGSAVALHCCKAHAKINGKIENSTPCKIVSHEDFNLKLGTRDYVAEATHHATLGSNRPSGGFPPNRGIITPV